MSEQQALSVNKYTKILVPASSYDMAKDSRLLIPFTSGEKIGFVNRDGIIVVNPQYIMCYGECYNESDLIRVAVDFTYGFIRRGGKVATYHSPLYGLINSKGEVVMEASNYSIVPSIGTNRLFTVQNKDRQFGVLDVEGNEIVPFGKYDWIDGFDNGLARVKVGTTTNGQKNSGSKWGMIDETGKEVLPIEYDYIWNFYDKGRETTKVVKGETLSNVVFSQLLGEEKTPEKSDFYDDCHDHGTHYGEYAGTYAQDVAGYSDDVIDDAFDGDPDAYWNID